MIIFQKHREVYGNTIEMKQSWNNDSAIIDFGDDDNDSVSFKFKQKITGETDASGTKHVEIMVSLKYLSNFWKTLEKPLINCEINIIVTWSPNFITSCSIAVNHAITFVVTRQNFYKNFKIL